MDPKNPRPGKVEGSDVILAGDITAHRISGLCRKHAIPESSFGRIAVSDPRLVGDLRAGRRLRPKTRARVGAFIATLEGSNA